MQNPLIDYPTFSFNPEEHVYRLGKEILPGVTTILAKEGPDKRFYSPGSAEKGKLIHSSTAAMDVLGLEIEDFDESLQNQLSAWNSFKITTKIRFTGIEKIAFHPELHYAGTVDRAGILNNYRLVLDLKSGSKAKWHRWQVAAYALMLEEIEDRIYDAGGVVYLKKEGTYKFDFWEGLEFEDLKNEFLEKLKEYKETNG